jgi:hypothetical protein
MGWHDVAQICMNGHVINDSVKRSPQFNRRFCHQCGEKTITQCPGCGNSIEGEYHVESVLAVSGGPSPPPAFCHSCGTPFPWTTAKQRAAINLFLEEGTSQEEQHEFQQSIEEITKDSPQAQVASKRVGRLLKKVGRETASAIRDILVEIASESAKRIMFPPS